MTNFHRFKATMTPIGELEFAGIASTGTLDYADDNVVPGGCQLPPGRADVPLFRDHDPSKIVGRAVPTISAGSVTIRAQFAPPGASAIADETRALAKAGILTDLSVGFEPLAQTPNKSGGWTITSWRILEVSLVGVGCNPDAQIIQRGFHLAGKSGRVLSGDNHAKLSQAHGLLGEVLLSAGTDAPEKSFDQRRREAEALMLSRPPDPSMSLDQRRREAEALALAVIS